jgi:hypothetical protein
MGPMPAWLSRFLRLDSAEMTFLRIDSAEPTELVYEHPAKPCVVTGCDGTMYFHDRMTDGEAPHTFARRWYATWVCAQDEKHFEIIPEAEYFQIASKCR